MCGCFGQPSKQRASEDREHDKGVIILAENQPNDTHGYVLVFSHQRFTKFMGKKTNRKTKHYQRFNQLPKSLQDKLEDLLLQQHRIVDEKYKLAEKYIIPVVMNNFLTEYNKVRDKEIELEKSISSIVEQHGFSIKQLLDIRVELLKERYDAYLKKRGLE